MRFSKKILFNIITALFLFGGILSISSCGINLGALKLQGSSESKDPGDQNPPSSKPIKPITLNSIESQNKPIVIMISIDGFSAEYLKKYPAPTLNAWASEGIVAEGLIPSFPTLTFPNHISLVTGMYPGHHGIVGNNFYDEKRKEGYEMTNSKVTKDGSWYRGEPLWAVAEKNQMVSATCFWVGSESSIGGVDPTFMMPYDGKVSNEQRVRWVINWLKLPPRLRPHFISLYFSAVDDAGHQKGPNSKEVGDAIKDIDTQLGVLKEFVDRNFRDVQILVVSDHGMKAIEKTVDLSSASTLMTMKDSRRGALTYFYSDDSSVVEKAYLEVLEIQEKNPGQFQVYKAAELPLRWHLEDVDRRGDIIVVGEPGVYIGFKRAFETGEVGSSNAATHGWDVAKAPELQGLFIASGSKIRRGLHVPAFENVHVYPFVLDLLDLKSSSQYDGKHSVLAGYRRP